MNQTKIFLIDYWNQQRNDNLQNYQQFNINSKSDSGVDALMYCFLNNINISIKQMDYLLIHSDLQHISSTNYNALMYALENNTFLTKTQWASLINKSRLLLRGVDGENALTLALKSICYHNLENIDISKIINKIDFSKLKDEQFLIDVCDCIDEYVKCLPLFFNCLKNNEKKKFIDFIEQSNEKKYNNLINSSEVVSFKEMSILKENIHVLKDSKLIKL